MLQRTQTAVRQDNALYAWRDGLDGRIIVSEINVTILRRCVHMQAYPRISLDYYVPIIYNCIDISLVLLII